MVVCGGAIITLLRLSDPNPPSPSLSADPTPRALVGGSGADSP